MAHGDSRIGTWQVLLTISMVITPLSAHGESVPPYSTPLGVCVCTIVRVCLRVRVGCIFPIHA